jgi:hypothetical protein
MDASSRKQGAKRRSEPALVTELKNAVDEEMTPFCRAKKRSFKRQYQYPSSRKTHQVYDGYILNAGKTRLGFLEPQHCVAICYDFVVLFRFLPQGG